MTHKKREQYLSYISNEHLFKCIDILFKAYSNSKQKSEIEIFYKNKIDVLKLIADRKFNILSDEELIDAEVIRQIDKKISNAVGDFHEEILGGVKGFERGNRSGYDIKAKDNTLFAELKNKHNTTNSSSLEKSYEKLIRFADNNIKARCYWVSLWAKSSFKEKWVANFSDRHYEHDRVYKISGDKFYELITGKKNALFDLYKILPVAIDDFIKKNKIKHTSREILVPKKLIKKSKENSRDLVDQITFDNFDYYEGFDELK
jgi:hypothetical protein